MKHSDHSSNLVTHPSAVYPESLLTPANGMDLREFMAILSRHKKTIVLTALATLLAALFLTLLMKPVYRAESTLKIERYAANPVDINILNPVESRSDRDFNATQYELIQSRSLARRVINQLELGNKVESTGFISGIIRKLTFWNNQPANAQAQEKSFLKNLTVKPINNSQLVSVSYDSGNPEMAAKISNAISRTFIRMNLERRFDTASYSKEYLGDTLKDVKKSLDDAEKRLTQYANENNIVQDVDGESASNFSLKKQAEELIKAEKERIEAEARYNLFQQNSADKNKESSASKDPYILSLKKTLTRLESKYQNDLKKYSSRSNRMRSIRAQINDIREQIKVETQSLESSIEINYLAAKEKERMLRSQLDKSKQAALNTQSKSIKYNTLKREVEINQTMYNNLLEQLMKVNVAGGIGTNNISLIDKAGVPNRPHKPNLRNNLAFGLLFGLLLGMGLAFLREYISDSINNSESLEKITQLPVLGQIPNMKHSTLNNLAVMTVKHPKSHIAEAIRSLRTSLRFSQQEQHPTSTFITSATDAEGKSVLSTNLAASYAMAGEKVILIDADLRSSSIHHILELENIHGLSNLLAGQSNNEEVIRSCKIKGLDVITSGPKPTDPVELLSSKHMINLLSKLSDNYDHIIIDGPPVLGLADALVLSNLSDATLLTVRSEKAKKSAILDSIKRLQRAHANIKGTVISGTSVLTSSNYHLNYFDYPHEPETVEKPPKLRAL